MKRTLVGGLIGFALALGVLSTSRQEPVAQAQGLQTVLQGAPGPASAPWFVSIVPSVASNYAWQKFKVTGETTTVQTVKASSGEIGGWYISNVDNTAASCVQFFDIGGNGTVTLGTTASDMPLKIPASGASNLFIPGGIGFKNGIRLAAATTCTGNTAPSSGLDIAIWYF